MVPRSEKLGLIKAMEKVFQDATKERWRRQDFVPDPLETRFTHEVPSYVLFERDRMLAAVNEERIRRGLSLADLKVIDRAERLACGHVDYATKYPLYCVEIAIGE
jgi:hypothetical protein